MGALYIYPKCKEHNSCNCKNCKDNPSSSKFVINVDGETLQCDYCGNIFSYDEMMDEDYQSNFIWNKENWDKVIIKTIDVIRNTGYANVNEGKDFKYKVIDCTFNGFKLDKIIKYRYGINIVYQRDENLKEFILITDEYKLLLKEYNLETLNKII